MIFIGPARRNRLWKKVIAHRQVTISIDLFRAGVAFLNPGYHQIKLHFGIIIPMSNLINLNSVIDMCQ